MMGADDLENYETEMELKLYREYRDVVNLFSFVVETERRFYLANQVDVQTKVSDGEIYFDVQLKDAWVWDVYRVHRFVKSARVITFKDVNVEELTKSDLLKDLPEEVSWRRHGVSRRGCPHFARGLEPAGPRPLHP
jgi:hypothetical protein